VMESRECSRVEPEIRVLQTAVLGATLNEVRDWRQKRSLNWHEFTARLECLFLQDKYLILVIVMSPLW
jgi:hypothetical protein